MTLELFDETEETFFDRLRNHRAHWYPVSDQFPAIERIRNSIIDNHLDATIFGRNPESKKTETYAQAFERCFKIPLIPTNRKVKK